MILFDEINKTPEDAKTNARPKIESAKIYHFFQGESAVSKPKIEKFSIPDQVPNDQDDEGFSEDQDEKEEKVVKKPAAKDVKPIKKDATKGINIHKIEKDSGMMLTGIYNAFKKSAVKKDEAIFNDLKKMYGKKPTQLSVDQINEIKDTLFEGKTQLKFKELYDAIKKHTSYKNENTKTGEILKKHFENAIETGSNPDIKETPNKDKGFVNTILSLPQPQTKVQIYDKYNFIDEFYNNHDKYKQWAIKYEGKGAKAPVDADKENKDNQKPKQAEPKPAGGIGLFGKLGGGGANENDDKDKVASLDLVDKIKASLETNFAEIKAEMINEKNGDGKNKKPFKIDKEEAEEFNELLSGFLKSFKEISDLKNISENIRIVSDFFFKANGSTNINDLKKKIKYGDIDILDFWKEVDKWDKLEFKNNEILKYVFCFLYFKPESFNVNLKDLEHFYSKISKKNMATKSEEMRDMLKIVYADLMKMTGDNDPNKSVKLDYNTKMQDGVKINKGSVEELIHNLIKYTSMDGGKAKLLKIFEKHMDGQREVDMEGLKAVLDETGIENSKAQRQNLLKLLDSDKDVMISYEELERYIDSYNPEKSIATNMMGHGTKNGNMLGMLKEVCALKTDIHEDEYFLKDQYTTIVNSDHSALKRVEMILDEMKKKGQKKYFDTEFGPKDKNDAQGSKMALYTTGESPPGYIKPEAIGWFYPEEFAGEGYTFLDEEASSNEVMQGALGDCWFIGALSVLATRDELLIGGLNNYQITDDFEVTPTIAKQMSEGVYPPIFHGYQRYGIYVFRFFKNF